MLVFDEGLVLGKESLSRAVFLPRVRPSAKTLCRVPEHFPSANPQALGKDDLFGSDRARK